MKLLRLDPDGSTLEITDCAPEWLEAIAAATKSTAEKVRERLAAGERIETMFAIYSSRPSAV